MPVAPAVRPPARAAAAGPGQRIAAANQHDFRRFREAIEMHINIAIELLRRVLLH